MLCVTMMSMIAQSCGHRRGTGFRCQRCRRKSQQWLSDVTDVELNEVADVVCDTFRGVFVAVDVDSTGW